MAEETNNTPASNLISDFLRDRESQDVLAVAAEQGNDLATEGFGSDLREMSYAQVVAKYGRDVAENRFRIQNGESRLAEHRDDSSTLGQKIGDTALDAAAGFYGLAGNTVGALAVRPMAKLAGVDPDAASAVLADLTSGIVDQTRSYRSDYANENSRIQAIQNQLDGDDNDRQRQRDIDSGASEFTADLQRAGRDFLDAGANIVQDPEAVREIIGGSLGSLAPSAALARGAQIAALKGVGLLTASTRAATIASSTSAAAAIGATEASGTYADTMNSVMGMNAETLSASPVYAGLLEEGFTPSEARVQLANLTAEEAFRNNLPAAVALGVLTQRFETAPIGSFKGAGVVGGMRSIGSQGFEEAGQGFSSAVSGNEAIRANVDETQSTFEGAGEAAAQGLIGGIGQAGVSAAPATAAGAASSIIGSVVDASSAKTFNDPLTQEILGRENIAGRVASTARAASAPVIARATDADTKGEATATVMAREVTLASQEAIQTGEATPEFTEAVSQPDTTPVPENFKAVAAEGESFLGRVARVTEKLADKRTKFSDSDTAFLGEMFTRLKSMQPNMPASVQSKVKGLLQSPQAKRFEERLANLDHNQTQDESTPITPDVVAETVSVARTHPTNVNPVVVNKILKESGENLSESDVRVMTSAAKIASIVNEHQGRQVEISRDQVVGLTRLNGETTKKAITPEQTSRSLRVSGYTAADGETGLRSINDFASDIFQGAQNPEGTVINKDGAPVSVDLVMDQFSKLVTHMNNKVGALNDSFKQNNRKGTGPSLPFAGLVGGKKIVPAEQWKGSKVYYHRNNPNSVEVARRVAADQDAAVQVYNELRAAFPERFAALPEVQSVELLRDEGGYADVDTIAAEIDAQEASEAAAVQADAQLEVQKGEVLDASESLIEESSPTVLDEAVDAEAATAEEQNTKVEDDVQDTVQEEADVQLNEQDASIEIDQSDDVLRDDNGEAIKFYHGTNADFDQFNDKPVFLTTRKGLAREHARRADGNPRLIEVEVALANPLSQQIPDNQDPDAYWLQNSLKIETAKEAGGYDSILIFNNNEGMVIGGRDQITVTNPDFDGTREQNDQNSLENADQLAEPEESNLHESVEAAYNKTDNGAPKNLDGYLARVESSATMNPNTVAFAKKLIRPMIRAMNKRINEKKVSIGGKMVSLVDAMKEGEVQTYRPYRNTAIVDKNTGAYDQNMIELAGIALVDWMASAKGRDPNQLDETLEELGLSLAEISDDQLEAVLFGVSVPQAKATLAKDILRMWGRQENIDAPLSELVGIAEGVAAEMLTTIGENKKISLLEIVDLPVTLDDGKKVSTQTILVKGLENVQQQIKDAQGEGMNMLAREELFDVPKEGYSIGTKLSNVDTTQSRGNVKLSGLEQAAISKMQDTGHFKDEARADLMLSLGEEALSSIFGYVEDAEEIENNTYRRSVLGKNLSIIKNIRDVFDLLGKLKDDETPVYYPVGVTKVGRHQYQGVNPQTNKFLRALVTPTWSEVDLKDQGDMDAFWLGIAQASDLFKIEKMAHADVLAQVKDKFNAEYRTAVDLVKAYNETGNIDGAVFARAVGQVEPQVLAAIQSVAHLEAHIEGGAETMRTSLSVELDGLTNGAANMMVNFGQGEITQDDFHNFNRIGLFLGQAGKTVNQYFSARGPKGQKNLDLYEKTSGNAQANLFAGLKGMKPVKREQMLAAGRFAARFGNFEINEKTGQFEMTRNTAKNPMTKVNYGSSVGGVGRGVADDMLIKFYEKIQGIPADVDLETYFAYPGMQNDIRVLFGNTLPQDLGGGRFEFPASAVQSFQKNISYTLGEVLTGTTKNVIGDKITELNDMLVFSTNVQSQYVQMVFQSKLYDLAEKRAKEGKIRLNPKTQQPVITDLSRRDYNSVVRQMEKLSPIFVSDDQTLAVGGFQSKTSEMELSSNMNDKLNQKSHLPMPEDVGVAAIPYSVIGTGDAMMMNFIFGSEGAPSDVLGIFDGLDVPVTKLKEYAPYVNQQVMKTWERDVLAMVVANFEGFLAQTKGDPIVEQAFQAVKDKNKKSSVNVNTPAELAEQLRERHRQNAARKAVLKRITVSVDQMGGSDVGYTRGDEPMTLTQINREIQSELAGKTKVEEDVKIEIQESTADAVLKGMRLSTEQRKVAEILKPLMKDVKVVFGTVSQMNDYRQENFPDDGQVLEGNASYDAANRTIFLATTKSDTILHEMVHAATYGKVLDHFNGNTNEAVTRLEALMNEFLAADLKGVRVNEAKASILRETAQNNPESKAAAVNEFMAYALTNNQVRSALQGAETSLLKTLSQKVIQLMRRIMGGVPTSMFDHVVFNTKVLNAAPVEDVADEGGSGDNGGDTGNTDGGRDRFSNFWIRTITNYLTENFNDAKDLKRSFRPAQSLDADADVVIDGFRQVGMLANDEQRATFRAIYMVMRSQVKLEPTSVIGLTRLFKHVEENLTPDMFGTGQEANQTYSAVINSFDGPDATAVLLALSQTSTKFKAALDQVPDPEGNLQVEGSLSSMMSAFGQMFLNKVMGSVDFDNKTTKEVMQELADGMVALDQKREYAALRAVSGTISKADAYVSGKFSQLSNKQRDNNERIKSESRSKFKKILSNSVTLGTNLLDRNNSAFTADAAKRATHMNVPFLSLVPIREMVSEIIGTDRTNQDLVSMQDEVNFKISGMRQAYREDLPVILQNLFARHPEAAEWKSMHTVLGQTDFTRFLDPRRMQSGMQMLEESSRRQARIKELEAALDANLLPYIAQDAKDKSQQLADYMNGKGAGKLLMRNAYAIAKNLDGDFQESLVEVIDELVTIYTLDQMDTDVRETTVRLWQEDPTAVTGMVTYIQGLNEAEDSKFGISEQAKLNAYKGFIPNHGDKDTRIIIDMDANEAGLKKRGFTKLGRYKGISEDVVFDHSYYITTTRQGGAYSQGIMQNVQSTYRGVDINTGMSVTGETSGFISDDGSVDRIVQRLNRDDTRVDPKETLMPVFDVDGTILGFERAINPDVYKQHMSQDQNLALMLGAWAGRHVEEALAAEYNRTLIDKLDEIYQNRDSGEDDLFVNLKESKDPIYKESFKLWPQGIKLYADGKFDGNGPMIRKDQVNLSTGYREFSLADFWSGKTRMPKEVQKVVQNVSTLVMGPKALRILSTGEKFTQGAVSTAKDIIVIRSLVVPMANTVSNVVQLASRGVPSKQIVNGYRKKLAEIEEYNKNVTELIELEAKLRLAANNANQRRILKSKMEVIQDLNSKMSIAPIIDAGAYKNLSEGITELDADITKGRFGDVMESMVNRLPDSLASVGRLGLVSKSTEVYRVANRATQYGDFLAKAIYYDHLLDTSNEMQHDEAIAKMNEEFVNFSALPGRVRSGLESFGLTWFMAFKIRIMKIALQQLRENPVRSLAVNNLLPDVGSPINDNLGQVILDDRLDYATGYEMLFDAPGLNPWVNLLDG